MPPGKNGAMSLHEFLTPRPTDGAPEATNNAAAFIVGVIAMWITDILADRLLRFVKSRDKE